MKLHDFFNVLNRTSLVVQIFIGLIAGIAVALLWPSAAGKIEILGQIFITALKSVAPVLVFILVTAAISNYNSNQPTHIKPILILYLIGTLGASMVAVAASMMFPSELVLAQAADAANAPPSNVAEVMKSLVLSVVDNPVKAIANANFIGILAWAIGLGIALRHASDTTRQVVNDLSDGVSWIIKCVIRIRHLWFGGLYRGQCGIGCLAGLCAFVDGVDWFHVGGGFYCQSIDCMVENSPQSLPFGFPMFARKRCNSILHPLLCSQHPRQHEFGRTTGFGSRHLLGFDSIGCHH